MLSFDWTPIRYRELISVRENPSCKGAYADCKSEKRATLVEGRLGRATDTEASGAVVCWRQRMDVASVAVDVVAHIAGRKQAQQRESISFSDTTVERSTCLAPSIVFILAMSTGYRVHARVGGLLAKDISKWDGLR